MCNIPANKEHSFFSCTKEKNVICRLYVLYNVFWVLCALVKNLMEASLLLLHFLKSSSSCWNIYIDKNNFVYASPDKHKKQKLVQPEKLNTQPWWDYDYGENRPLIGTVYLVSGKMAKMNVLIK